ncbi:MAG TPA: DMT family transporter [Beijerinckiaceae bacterium]|nr:DMT family transporter [Beijerinckiaceae bacterium]
MSAIALPRSSTKRFPILPAAFILLWSSGYIGGAIGVRYAEPFTMTACRFGMAAVIFLCVAIALRSPWPRRLTAYVHAAVVGVLLQALQFGGLYTGIRQGVPAGEAALIVGMMPIFVILGASIFLDEKLSLRDIPGSLLGIGGVAIVVASNLGHGHAQWSSYAAVGLALVGITSGTIYQKKFMGGIDLWVGCFIQMVVAATIMLALAYSTETMHVTKVVPFVAAVGWITLMNSVGALTLLYTMIRRGEASKATNLFHLIPAVTQIMASITLGEVPGVTALLGFAVSGSGVFLMNKAHRK